MKKYIFNLLALICLMSAVSCVREGLDGEGFLSLKFDVQTDKVQNSRTSMTEDELNASCHVKIRNVKDELIREYYGLSSVPSELQMLTGDYRIIVTAGKKVDVSFDSLYYEGESDFVIEKSKTTEITVPVYIQNTVVQMEYTESARNKFSECKVTVSMSKGALEFDINNPSQQGYFSMPNGETELDWSLVATTVDGISYTKEGVITSVKASTKYTLKFDYQELEPQDGGMYVEVDVDETPLFEKDINVEIGRAPVIQRYENGTYYSIDEPLNFGLNDEGREVVISIKTSSELKSVQFTCPELKTLMGMSFETFDIHTMANNVRVPLEEKGITYFNEYLIEEDASVAKITLSPVFFKYFTSTDEEKTYYIDLVATDNNKRVRNAQVRIMVSNAIVSTDIVEDYLVWSNKATVSANVNRTLYDALEDETAKVLSFNYRVKGTQDWSSASATLDGSRMTAELTGLNKFTTYEYTAVCAGQASPAAVYEFTTEDQLQLSNAGFEDWYKSDKVWLIYGQGGSMFWDSGNHGSATLNVNVTNYDETVKAPESAGTRSIKMESQYVSMLGIGKFAAGNVFAGQYVRTDGTDGVLAFGRSFTARPTKLRGYVKYISTPITDRDGGAPADAPAIGENDHGILYVALGDWPNETGLESPFEVRTKDKKLFDKSGPNVIAYGEMIKTSSTEGSDMIPFEINLDYKDLTRKPLYIIVVGSASKYGDYFTGGRGSTMWLDDLELVYE